jgi:hypothetical protein
MLQVCRRVRRHVVQVRDPRHHLRRPAFVRVDIAAAHPRLPDAPRRVVGYGLDPTGRGPGLLHHWYEAAVGDWYGIVDYEIR